MQKVNIAEARQKLPELMHGAYFESKTYLLTRRGIPMAKIIPISPKAQSKSKYNKEEVDKALKAVAQIWKNRWKGKTSKEISQILRKKAWYSHAR